MRFFWKKKKYLEYDSLWMRKHQYCSHTVLHSPGSHPPFLCGHTRSAPGPHHIHMSRWEGWNFKIWWGKNTLSPINHLKTPLPHINIHKHIHTNRHTQIEKDNEFWILTLTFGRRPHPSQQFLALSQGKMHSPHWPPAPNDCRVCGRSQRAAAACWWSLVTLLAPVCLLPRFVYKPRSSLQPALPLDGAPPSDPVHMLH